MRIFPMYGKIFESLYRGSMVGAGTTMFAVWPYVIANMRADSVMGAQVDLNPKLLAFILGTDESDVRKTIDRLCSTDDQSTSKKEDGRRLIKIGEFTYRVVNGASYMEIRNEEERREYFRLAKRLQREKNQVQAQLPGIEKPIKRFQPPTLEEVQARFAGIGKTPADASDFWNYYGSNGWKVGPNPMRDWHKAASRWKSNTGTYAHNPRTTTPRTYDRNKGTANEGKAQQYQVPVTNAQV
jgi:hypothetical protein